MGAEKTKGVMTPEFRVSFPNVFKPKKNDLSGEDEYSVQALFSKSTDLSVLKKAAEAAMEKKWGADRKKWPTNFRSPFRLQDERAKTNDDGKKVFPPGYEEGAVYLNLKTKQRPGVVDKNVQPIIDETEFYPGCYARATISAYAYDAKGNKGVAFGLGNIQKVRDGEPLGGRMKAEDEFAAIEGATEGDASTVFG